MGCEHKNITYDKFKVEVQGSLTVMHSLWICQDCGIKGVISVSYTIPKTYDEICQKFNKVETDG